METILAPPKGSYLLIEPEKEMPEQNIEKSITTLDQLLGKWQHSIIDFLPKVLLALVILIIFYGLAKLIRRLSFRFYLRLFKKQNDLAKLVSLAFYTFLLLSGVFLALEVLGLEGVLTKLLAGAGVLGIVAGFAFKDIASNAFAGLLLNIQRPFKSGDWVTIDENFGTIKDIGWITTSINTIEGPEVFVPNQLIYNNTFANYSSRGKRRIILKSGVSYGDDLDLVKKAALEEVRDIPSLREDEVVDFYFTDIGDSSYNFVVRFWVDFHAQKDYLEAMSETIMRIKKRFEQEDISLAYAVTTLDFGVKGGVNIFDQAVKVKKV